MVICRFVWDNKNPLGGNPQRVFVSYPFQPMLAIPCQPKLAQSLWVKCFMVRRRIIEMATRRRFSPLKVLKIILVMGYSPPLLYFLAQDRNSRD
jgi:hypothetical protein